MSAEPTHTINQSTVQNFLRKATRGCGGALNSFLVVLGDKTGLHATSSYSRDVEEPIVRSHASSITQKRAHRDETAFMTLICHDCAAATHSHKATP
jgi:hypothetical protein